MLRAFGYFSCKVRPASDSATSSLHGGFPKLGGLGSTKSTSGLRVSHFDVTIISQNYGFVLRV